MKCYETITRKLLHDLGAAKKLYRGCDYVISSICYIAKHDTSFTPITKILYPAIGKIYKVSPSSIEHGIRDTIELIWMEESNISLRAAIFGNPTKKPANTEFLMSLYRYVHQGVMYHFDKHRYTCPASGGDCLFFKDMIEYYLDEFI